MRRFVTLSLLLLSSIPFGVSISGCSHHNAAPVYCNGGDSGPTTTQVSTITLSPILTGISLNYAEIGQMGTPSATDCKGSTAYVQAYIYGTTDMTIADVQPSTGRICAGTWNRNTGGGIADFTTCNPTNKSGTAYISASAEGATSNPIAIYVHPVVTSVVLGGDSLGSCLNDPTTACAQDATQSNGCSVQNSITEFSITNNVVTFIAPNSLTAGQSVTISGLTTGTYLNGQTLTVLTASSTLFTAAFTHADVALTSDPGLVTVVGTTATPVYTGTSCLSQGKTAQLVSRVYSSVGVSPFTGLTSLGSNQVTSVSTGVITALTSAIATYGTVTVSSTAFPSGTTITSLGSNTITLSTAATATNTSPITFTAQQNISCLAGHLQYGAQGATSTTTISSQVSIDENGVATAGLPGSVLISATIADASSSAGFFSTCPPASITLSATGASTPGTPASPVVVNENNTQPLSATVLDTNGVQLTGLTLEYLSTSPTAIPVSSNGVAPFYAGAASITALCQPSSCNPSPLHQIGLLGNGVPVVSNSLNVTTPGVNSTVLYMASTQSKLVTQIDFTTSVMGSPFQLPWVPNSMVISQDGLSIYLGSSSGMMTLSSTTSLSISSANVALPGTVLAISSDGSTLVLSDPVKQITSLVSSSGSVVSTYSGVATRAQFTPDFTTGSGTVYITAGDQLLAYSAVTGWANITPQTASPATLKTPVTDVAITVPSVGAYFAGSQTTARGYCPASTPSSLSGMTTESNVFFPTADDATTRSAVTDRIAATNDGQHILGVTATTTTPTLSDLRVTIPTGACTSGTQSITSITTGLSFPSTLTTSLLSKVTPTAITGVIPSSDSTIAFVTYTGSGGLLPAYAPSAAGAGTTSYIALTGTTVTAPVAGVFWLDSSEFDVGTLGDNLVHRIQLTAGKWVDNSTLNPNLTSPSGTAVPVDMIVQKVRRTT